LAQEWLTEFFKLNSGSGQDFKFSSYQKIFLQTASIFLISPNSMAEFVLL